MAEAVVAHTVGELIAALSKFSPDAPVLGTWESVVRAVHVYQSKNGTVLLDVDECSYQDEFENGFFDP